jgi:pimeloyl-ACP methyl ester carboxylesterase
MKRAICLILLALSLGYGAALAGLWWQQDGLIFPRRVNTLNYTPNPTTHNYQVLNLTLPDGTLQQVVQSPRQVMAASPTLIMAFAGNAHDVGGMVLWLRHVYGSSTIVLGAPYRGYSSAFTPRQPGQPTQAHILADATHLTRWAQATFKPHQTLLVGYSLGSSVATHTALEVPISATILITPFTSMAALANTEYPWLPTALVNALLRHPFPTKQWLAQGSAPVALIGAGNDGLIPPTHLPELAKAAQGRMGVYSVLSGTTHGGALDDVRLPTLLQKAVASWRGEPQSNHSH